MMDQQRTPMPSNDTLNPRAAAARSRCHNCCEGCKRLHRKCDNGQPCGTCVQKRRPCIRRDSSPTSSDSSNSPNSPISIDPGSPANTPSPSSDNTGSQPNTPSTTCLSIEGSVGLPMARICAMFGPGTYAVPVNDVYLIIYNRDELVFKALLDNSYRVIEEVVIGSQRELAECCSRVTPAELADPKYSSQATMRGVAYAASYNSKINP